MPRPVRTTGVLVIAVIAACDKPHTPPAATRPAATMAPASAPATAPATAPTVAVQPGPTDVLSVVRLDDPNYPTRYPLDLPADIADAAKIVLNRPAYVDPIGNLWITHPQGRPIAELLASGVVDRTAVVREVVHYVSWPAGGGPGSAVVSLTPDGDRFRLWPDPQEPNRSDARLAGLPEAYRDVRVRTGRTSLHFEAAFEKRRADFAKAQIVNHAIVAPCEGGGLVFYQSDLSASYPVPGPGGGQQTSDRSIAMASDGTRVWAWSPWENGQTGGIEVKRIQPAMVRPARPALPDDVASTEPSIPGIKSLQSADGWPDKLVEAIPLADGSVLTVAQGDDNTPLLKLIPAADKPPTSELVRTVDALARKLADEDPAERESAQRALEQQGPAAYPVLESLREQLPPEAQIRIETLLGQRFAPTLAGLRPLPGDMHTIARFADGGCVLRLDGGGTIDGDGDEPTRTVIPATVIIRPGRFIERIEPDTFGEFVPGKQTIQWVGGELILGDPKLGPRRIVGTTAKPVLPATLVDFDTVRAIDGRRRWLLTSAKRSGQTLLIDPSLPDTTPKLPVWTVAATGSVGRTADGWPAVRRADRLFVLDRDGWHVDKVNDLRPPPLSLPAVFDRDGNRFIASGEQIERVDAAGRVSHVDLPNADDATLLVTGGLLLAYTPDGTVRRYAITDADLKPEATFTQGVPANAEAVWLDPAGRLVMAIRKGVAIGFPDGRVPRRLGELILSVEK